MSNGFASNLLLDLTAELLSRGTTVRFRPSGRSMYPSIREGELITVEPVVPSDVQLGDIILYRSERGLIAHRVVGTDQPSSPTQSSSGSHHSLTQSSVLSPQSSSGPHHSVLNSVLSPHYFLRGDASLCCDQPVEAQQILGRVVRVERNGRSVALASQGAKMWHKARRWASRLRRAIRRPLSAANQTFTVGDAATAGSTITVTDHATTPTIRAANDIGISIRFPLNGSGTSVTPTQVFQS